LLAIPARFHIKHSQRMDGTRFRPRWMGRPSRNPVAEYTPFSKTILSFSS
jgi:hypothetical protein